MEQLFKKEDFLTMMELREELSKDANYGVYIINSARIANNTEQYSEIGVESPIAENTIDATININIGTVKEPNLVSVPPTWIPISLADYGEPLEIFKSQGFKGMYERGYLALIRKEAYERIMDDDGAREARQHMMNEKYASSANQSNDQLINHLNNNASKRATRKTETPTKKVKANKVCNAAYEFADKNPETNHVMLFQKYRNLEPKLSTLDLEYIIKNTVVAKIKTAAQKRLDALLSV